MKIWGIKEVFIIVKQTSSNIDKSICDFIDSANINENHKILLKPNWVSFDEYPYTTSLEIINKIINYLISKGCNNIVVADVPAADQSTVYLENDLNVDERKFLMNQFHQKFRTAITIEDGINYLQTLGPIINRYYEYFFSTIKSKFSNYNITVNNLLSDELNLPHRDLTIGNNTVSKIIDISDFDVILNLPVLKIHTTTGFTGAVKNFFALFSLYDKMELHKNRLIGKSLCGLHTYLQKLNIHTFLDCRVIPDSQQRVWGSGKVHMLDMFIYGDNLWEIDHLAHEELITRNLLSSVKDETFLHFVIKKN